MFGFDSGTIQLSWKNSSSNCYARPTKFPPKLRTSNFLLREKIPQNPLCFRLKLCCMPVYPTQACSKHILPQEFSTHHVPATKHFWFRSTPGEQVLPFVIRRSFFLEFTSHFHLGSNVRAKKTWDWARGDRPSHTPTLRQETHKVTKKKLDCFGSVYWIGIQDSWSARLVKSSIS